MESFKKIVVGLELDAERKAVTEGSLKAVQQASWVAKANSGKILFLHSTYNDEEKESGELARMRLRDGIPGEAQDALDAVVERARAEGLDAELELSSDRIWLDISRKALRDEADLVVVGKRNEATAEGRKLGSVAIKLLRKCPAAVWVVKPAHDLVHRLVLGATGLSEVGALATRYAASVAKRHGCALHIVHAYQVPLELQLESARLDDEEYNKRIAELKATAREKIIAGLGSCCPEGDDLHLHIGKGSPSVVLKEAVAHFDPDLLVMGTIARGGIAGLLVGSTAERLLWRVDCSILAVKPVDFVSPITLH